MSTLTAQPAAKDTYLSEFSNTTNFDGGALQPRDWLNAVIRAPLEFDISSISGGATLNSATLSLKYYAYGGTDPVGRTLWAYKLSRTDWVEDEATWDIYKTGSNWTAGGGDYVTSSPAGGSAVVPAATGWIEFDVLDIVQDAYDGGNAAEFLVKFADETIGATYGIVQVRDSEYATAEDRPKLVVVYNLAAPTVTTQAVSSITETTATGNGNITDTGGVNCTRRGFCYKVGTTGDPTTADSTAYDDGNYGTGAYTKSITGLTTATSYRVRAYAINTEGTGYGSTVDLETDHAPTVTTQAVSNISTTTATGNGNITDLGGDNPTAHGVCYNTTGSPTLSDTVTDEGGTSSTGAFTSSMTSLVAGTKYYVKAYATNAIGTSYGSEVNFTAYKAVTVTTQTCQDVVGTTATGRGNITVLGEPAPTAHGHCWAITADPDTNDSSVDNGAASATGTFTSAITGLTAGTGYYTRAFATNSVGTSYGANVYFIASLSRAGYIWMEGSNFRGFDENAVEGKYIRTADVDDTAVNGETEFPISSNWAYDHVAAADPHTGYVLESLFDAHTVLYATSDNTPAALTVTEQTLVGRLTGGNISAVAMGIADNNILQVDHVSPANLDYAKFTTSGLEGRSYQELVNDISGIIKATDVEVSELSAATYDDAQDYINFFGDRTLLSGGGITDNGNGTATVASGTAWAKATDSDAAVGKFFNFSADNSVALTDLITNYVYLDYNEGTPQIVVTTTSITTHGFKQDHIHIATLFRNGNTLHFHEEDAIGIGRMNIADMRLLEMHDADRASGLITTDATSLALNVSAGVIYEGLNRHTTDAQIPASWSTWYTSDSGSTWTEVTGQTTIDNTQYNDVTSGLEPLTSNRYAVHWLYVDIDGANLFIIYGRDDYTINGAEEAGVPASLPDIAVHYGVLIAKIIVQKDDTTLEILYPWTTTFHSSKATDHGNLAGLGDDDHAQYLLADGTRALAGAWDMGSQNLTNVNIDGGTMSGITLDGAVTGGGQNITNLGDVTVANLITAGNVDGVDVSAHAANTTTAHGAVSAATASKHVVRDASARAKFAAPGASGDALIKGTRVTTAELPAMTDEKIWKGTGANVEEVDVYTDAAALAAAVQAGAITNAVTKAPTHDAVFDVKTTADGAIAKSLLTTRGDIIYRNATVPARLAKGTEGHILTMGADDPAWAAPAAAAGATSAEALAYALSS